MRRNSRQPPILSTGIRASAESRAPLADFRHPREVRSRMTSARKENMKIALDTQLVMRTQARRLITGAAEVAGAAVIVPETAAFFAKLHYHKVARRYVAKRVEWKRQSKGSSSMTRRRRRRPCNCWRP